MYQSRLILTFLFSVSLALFSSAQPGGMSGADALLNGSMGDIKDKADMLRQMGVSETQINELRMQHANSTAAQSAFEDASSPSENPDQLPRVVAEHPDLFENLSDTVAEEEEPQAEQLYPDARIFGQQFFRNGNLKIYETVADVKAPDSYILGSGDEISISVWGYSQYDAAFKITRDGYIQPYGVGRIYLKGLEFDKARALVKRRFSGYLDLANSQFAINLSYSRVINVNIVGEVFNPGTYQLSAINSAFNALVAAGGPNDIGSLREIFIKRNGVTVKKLDLYEYLLNDKSEMEFYLRENDYIFVPPANKIVGIYGEVKKPFHYELISDENLMALVKFSGGLKSSAYSKSAQLTRFDDNQLVLRDVYIDSLKKIKSDFMLHDGDSIAVFAIPEILRNTVHIVGNVKIPGKYEFREGQTVKDLIDKAEGLLPTTYLDRAYVLRQKPDMSREYIDINLRTIIENPSSPANILLQNYDKIQVFSKEEFREDYYVSIHGAVRNQGDFLYGAGMTLKDLLYFAGGLKKEAAKNRIEIARILNFDEAIKESVPTTTIIETIEIGYDLTLDVESENFEILPYDQVFIRKTPEFEPQRNVHMKGQVNFPGLYSLEKKDERLLDVINRAGGFTSSAFLGGIQFLRKENDRGYVFVDIEKAMKNPNSPFNYHLRDGDEIIVPELVEFVTLNGEIMYPDIDSIGQINSPYRNGKRAKFYVNNYGAGFDKNAKRSHTQVQWPDGVSRRTKNFGLFKVYPKVKEGSTITVYAKEPKEERTKDRTQRDPTMIHTTIASVTASLTGAITLFILMRNLNR